MMKLKVVENLYVEKPQKWVKHHRSKNYIAHITGFDPQYTFKREFLSREKVGRITYFLKKDFIVGEIYEIKCIYYTRSGKACTELDGFFKCIDVNQEVVLEEVEEDEVIRVIKEKYAETAEISETQKQIKKLEEEKQKRLEELKVLQQAREELEEDINKLIINEDEIRQLKDELKQRIVTLAKKLLLLGTAKYDRRVYQNEKATIGIKEEHGKLKYININGTYVFSQYGGDVSLQTLYNAYTILKNEVEECIKEIEKIADNLNKKF